MRSLTPTLLVLLAVSIGALTIVGDDSYSKYVSLQGSLDAQVEKNDQLESKVGELRRKVTGLQSNPRELERAARDELGMARPDELIFVFDRKEDVPAR